MNRQESFLLKYLLENALKHSKSFAIFSRPGNELFELYFGKSTVNSLSGAMSQAFIIQPFDYSSPTIQIIPENEVIYFSSAGKPAVSFSRNDFHLLKRPKTKESDYKVLVSKAVEEISKKGTFQKVVLSRTKEIPIPARFDPIIFLHLLKENYPDCFVSLISTPETGTWLGATPEMLLWSDSGWYETIAMAGTISKDKKKEEFTEKEYVEQNLVHEYIRNILTENGYRFTETSANPHQAGTLVHLKSVFSGRLNEDTPIIELVSLLHPTPAICGYPSQTAFDFISQNEAERSLYGGFIGPVTDENSFEFHVNLRCMEMNPTHFIIHAGAGITSESDAEKEFEETERKMAVLEKLI